MTSLLVSLDQIKEFLTFREGVTKYDSKLLHVVRSASTMVEQAIRRSLEAQEHTEYFNALQTATPAYDWRGDSEHGLTSIARDQTLYLTGMGIKENTVEVYYDPSGFFGDVDPLVIGEDYVVAPETDSIILKIGTRQSRRSIKVVYEAGYSKDADTGVLQDVPADIQQAVIVQSLHIWNRMNPDSVSASQDAVDGYKIGSPLVTKGGLLPDVIALLIPYRRVNMVRS